MPNWETDEHGLPIFKPIVCWEAAVLTKTGCSLRVEFLQEPDDIGTSAKGFNLR
jgi:hypothetical protein